MTARRIFDVIADILILLALAFAAVGHLLPWAKPEQEKSIEIANTETQNEPANAETQLESTLTEFQQWYALRSGAALGAAALLVGFSLVFDPGLRLRKLLVLLTFASVFVAIVFQMMIHSPYTIATAPRLPDGAALRGTDDFLWAVISTVVAGALCLVRMTWTMTASTTASTQVETPHPRSSPFE